MGQKSLRLDILGYRNIISLSKYAQWREMGSTLAHILYPTQLQTLLSKAKSGNKNKRLNCASDICENIYCLYSLILKSVV